MTLKLKSSYWLVTYTASKSCKQISYMTTGESLFDVFQNHIQNPKYEKTNVVGIIQIQDNKESYGC